MFAIDTLIWLIPTLPLAATLVTTVLGKNVLRGQSHWPTVLAIAASAVLSLVLVVQVDRAAKQEESRANAAGEQFFGYERIVSLYTWADVENARVDERGRFAFDIDVTLRADPLTAAMLAMVTFVSSLVAIYSIDYMRGDPGYWRFFTYISLFVFSMTMLVSVSNFLLLYVFWEAVGVCSYLLIGFWFQKPVAAAAGKKAFLVNRIGDFGFALGVFLIWTTLGTLNFHDTSKTIPGALGEATCRAVAQRVEAGVPIAEASRQAYASNPGFPAVTSGALTAICLLLFLGACGKSAQFPLHVWLPDAMEGPTPVSALIHAATMVTAGVYLVARCAPMFLASGSAQLVVAAVGCFTALLAATIALTQTDLKRILAYSTISQLGYMFLGLGTMTALGITASMFHLLTHAFFKALLFLGAGSVMHAMGNVIDIREFGGLRKRLPVTHWTFLVGCLALAGLFPFAGFWSKDFLLGAVYDQAHPAAGSHDAATAYIYQTLWIVAMITAAMTAFYTFRAFFRTFYGEEKIPVEAGDHAHESPPSMTAPLAILALFAAVAGAFWFIYPGFLGNTPTMRAMSPEGGEMGHVHLAVAIPSVLISLGGIGAASFLYLRGRGVLDSLTAMLKSGYVYQLSQRKFFIDEVYYLLFVWPLKIVAAVSRFLDNFLIDGLVNLCGWFPTWIGSLLRPLQIGLVQFYALAMMLGLVVLIGSLLWW